VLRDGTLQQFDTPHNLFHGPANLFVAAFIGSPSMNLVDARVEGDTVKFANVELALPASSPVAGLERDVILGLRPTCFQHAGGANPELPRFRVRPDVVEDLGDSCHVLFTVDAPRVTVEAVRAAADTEDEGKLFSEAGSVFTAVVDSRQRMTVGSDLDLAVDNTSLHFFDPGTGLALDGVPRSTVAV